MSNAVNKGGVASASARASSASLAAPVSRNSTGRTSVSSYTGGPPNYRRLERLGKGSFATVYRAVHLVSNQEAAIKDILQERLTLKLQENLESEISILKNHAHRNIVRLYDIERSDKHIYIILEYCRGGDLQRFIKNQPGARLGEATAQHFLRHLAAGLKFLNDRNLVHRDIKPQNLLLTENSPHAVLKIADFGFARHLEGSSMAETLCGSPLYMAPEILGHNQYNAKADLWSVGAVLFEMVAGRPPFAAQNQAELLRVIKRPLQIPAGVDLSAPCLALLQRLLKREPLERISFEDFFTNDFIDMKGSGILLEENHYHVSAGLEGVTSQQVPLSLPGQEGSSSPQGTTSPVYTPEPSPAAAAETLALRQTRISESPSPWPASVSRRAPAARPENGPAEEFECEGQEALEAIWSRAGRVAAPLAAVARRAMLPAPGALPFQTEGATTSQVPHPTPRGNPFKPLAASPPGAVALSHQGRSTSAPWHSSRRTSSPPSSLPSSSFSSGPGGTGGGDGAESVESDGFVIVHAGVPQDTFLKLVRQPPPRPSSYRPPASLFHHPFRDQEHPTKQHRQQHQQEFASCASKMPPSGGLPLQLAQTHTVKRAEDGQPEPRSCAAIRSTDSVEGALRVLAYVEHSTRRAVLIASLGDAAAIAALSVRRGVLKAGSGCLASAVQTILLHRDWGSSPDRAGKESVFSSTETSSSSLHSSSGSLSTAAREGAKASALLVDALVLYLKSLSVVGTAIKALRQVVDVIQIHSDGQLDELCARYGQRCAALKEAGGHETGRECALSTCGDPFGASAGMLSTSSLQERISSLQGWLELHFSVILDRAQECRAQMDKQGQEPAERPDLERVGVVAGEESEWAASRALVTRSAEELLYKHALSLAKEGAVKELLGQWGRGRELYAQARLMMEALLAEPLLSLEDQTTLQHYQAEFCSREEELARADSAARIGGNIHIKER